jgi:hypothetical protein
MKNNEITTTGRRRKRKRRKDKILFSNGTVLLS